MRILVLLAGAAFAIALIVTSLFTSLAASSAIAADPDNATFEFPAPNYVRGFQSPLLPSQAPMPVVSH